MKTAFINLTFLSLFIWSCQRNTPDPTTGIVTECVGISDYLVNNQSSYDLSIELVFTPGLGSKTDTTQTVRRDEIKRIGTDSKWGSIPKPVDTYSQLTLYRFIDGKKVSAYIQNPVLNVHWIKTKSRADDPDFGCQSVTHTLLISDADLY
ncbi:hypothetical protein [Spirosoma fluviale]|uniref:Uncharacterized protein n=1 Tax=Spirosoma fluviale TaxID=1597977 RepID=A0A286FFN0_9BACT|nr:hypothetical protein [Spirosoma fluviale]SOD82003.1 hypothetical protein SAMN06269250_1988 [Spirosoma fluviale]